MFDNFINGFIFGYFAGAAIALAVFFLVKKLIAKIVLKKNEAMAQNFFKYFKVEHDATGTSVVADITDEDLKRWLYAVTRFIQESFGRHAEIKNYLVGDMVIGGQKIEFAFVKDFREGPHAMRLKSEAENTQLKHEISRMVHEFEIAVGTLENGIRR